MAAHDARTYEHHPASAYQDREGRNQFIAAQFAAELGSSVLNVGGGGKRHLAQFLPSTTRYVEVDIAGTPDVTVDLERELPLAFGDRSFDTVVCSDVLEHVDNLHAVFAELCRVARSHVILSLPNCWANLKGDLARGNGASGKFYGIPRDRPEDRHKWFFSFTEAAAFVDDASARHGFEIARSIAMGYVHTRWSRRLARVVVERAFGPRARFNLFATTLFVALRRIDG